MVIIADSLKIGSCTIVISADPLKKNNYCDVYRYYITLMDMVFEHIWGILV